MRGNASVTGSVDDVGSTRSIDDENPFELSDGLRWYMIDASEEKLGAPGTPSVGKSTVTASNIEVKGHMGLGRKEHKSSYSGANAATTMVTKTLTKSLDSRRSSAGSKKSMERDPKARHGHDVSRSSVKDTAAVLAPITSDTDAEMQAHAAGSGARNESTVAENAESTANAPANEGSGSGPVGTGAGTASFVRQPTSASETDRGDAHVFEVVRRDLLLGP